MFFAKVFGLVAAVSGSGVIELTDDNFSALMNELPNPAGWFVNFHTNWCGHCKALNPIWHDFAKSYAHGVNVAEIDCTDSSLTCDKYQIRAYPTLYYFPADNSQIVNYTGGRNVASLEKFILQQSSNNSN